MTKDKTTTYILNFLMGFLFLWSCIGFALGFLSDDILSVLITMLGIMGTSSYLILDLEVKDGK